MTNKQFQAIDVFGISGADHLDFFKNQIISDFDPESNHLHYTAICNPKGRVIFTLLLQRQDQHTLVGVDRSLSDNFLQYVNMRRFRMDMDIQKTENRLNLNFDGPGGGFGSLGFQVDLPNHPEFTAFWSFFFDQNLPWITADSTEQHIPQHLNMDQANTISFTKGCYPGQEIVARLHYLGQVKKRLQTVVYQAEEPASNGSKVTTSDQSKAIELCSESLPFEGQWQAQAMMPAAHTATN